MKDAIKFAFHISVRPFDGFWDMKYEKKGKMKVAIAIIFMVIVANIFDIIAGGFLFNGMYGLPVNIMYELRKIILPVVLFCLANWSVTTLMDGEGSMKDITMATGYAMLPMIIVRIPLTIAGNFLTLNEAAYFKFFVSFITIWFCFLLFCGIMTVHQYSVLKTVVTLFITIIAMFVIVFIGAVFFSLLTQLVGFVYSIYKEIMLRI